MSELPWAGRRLHFIGIGGAGMSGLALVAQSLGAAVGEVERDRPAEPVCAADHQGAAAVEGGHGGIC